MEFEKTIFKDAWLIVPKVYTDERGFFMESYSKKWFEEKDINIEFVQDNYSKSNQKGVLRGLHFQLPPHTQKKLIRVIKGKVFDVIVDLRKDSATYGKWQSFELSEQNNHMLFIPKGFAHGFCTLVPNTEFFYKVDKYYAPKYEDGIIWNDSKLAIDWPVNEPIISDRDKSWNSFDKFNSPFI